MQRKLIPECKNTLCGEQDTWLPQYQIAEMSWVMIITVKNFWNDKWRSKKATKELSVSPDFEKSEIKKWQSACIYFCDEAETWSIAERLFAASLFKTTYVEGKWKGWEGNPRRRPGSISPWFLLHCRLFINFERENKSQQNSTKAISTDMEAS